MVKNKIQKRINKPAKLLPGRTKKFKAFYSSGIVYMKYAKNVKTDKRSSRTCQYEMNFKFYPLVLMHHKLFAA